MNAVNMKLQKTYLAIDIYDNKSYKFNLHHHFALSKFYHSFTILEHIFMA